MKINGYRDICMGEREKCASLDALFLCFLKNLYFFI